MPHKFLILFSLLFWGGGEEKLCGHPGSNHRPRGQKIGILFNIETLEKKFSKYPRFVRNFLKKKIFFKNFDFFTKDVLKRLLGGMKTISVIYQEVFEK